MSTQLQGYIIPRSKMFEVSDRIREKFLNAEYTQRFMERFDPPPYQVETHLQVFEIGTGRQFVRLVSLSSASDLEWPKLTEEDFGGRLVHYDDRAESLTAREYAFCDKIDELLKARHYVLVPIFSWFIWNLHQSRKAREKS